MATSDAPKKGPLKGGVDRARAWLLRVLGVSYAKQTDPLLLALPQPPLHEARSHVTIGASAGQIAHTVETTVIMSAALAHMNRRALATFLQQIMKEADERCRSVEARLDEESKRRAELEMEIKSLRLALNAHEVRTDAHAPRRG